LTGGTNTNTGSLTGNPNAPTQPYAPTNYGMNRNPTGNLGQQQSLGMNSRQPNMGGLGGGTNTTNYRMGQTAPYNPPVSIPTGEVPPAYHGGTAAPPIPSYAVPNGRPQNAGLTMYTNPTTGLHQWGAGTGGGYFDFSGGGPAFHPGNRFGPIGQMLQQGFGQHQQGGGQPGGFGLHNLFRGY
jgi:hypothetical protein